ncbi:MAG: DUF2797 domain-containing protein [Methyloprofundus sp.]|nr:DUF2797 domain-containing protein [Methyloprofundus sp.]MDT8425105.1 DUF2797 domain-containing protein [Methyloprofundus sp.]
MITELQAPVKYQLPLGEQLIELNPFIGKNIKLSYTGNIACVHCQRAIKKSFNQGFCYPCFISLAQCDICIMKPETCHYAAGTCREPSWGEAFCFQPHYVYLANSSGVKVGITRHTQVPTRWIDQGAVQALPVLKVQSRYLSGLVEVIIAEYISDKTSWQKMLKNGQDDVDLIAKRDELFELVQERLDTLKTQFGEQVIEFLLAQQVVDIHYPVDQYPSKIKSFNFDKNPVVEGVLHGIKGQYLLLDTGVINIRKFTGYEVAFSV